ncbi:MAG: DUF2520 domain-containing protein [Chloroflexi bacterium]|nr:DUF2520 domain-containing protein [Chloroflexota bacterium]
MRAWDEAEREAARRRDAAADEAGLPPAGSGGPGGDGALPSGAHRHGDVVHPGPHRHPHVEPPDDGRPVLGIVGAGPVGTALGVAFSRAGWHVGAVASRDAERRRRFASLVPGARALPEAQAIVDECHLVVVAVPDDAVASVARGLRLYSGQAIVHTSGALGAEVLAPSLAAGTQAGGFHPLIAFADVDRAVAALRGATVAVEAEPPLLGLLGEMASSVGAHPVVIPHGAKAAYHAAAVLAAAGTIALLDSIASLGRVAGLDEAQSLAVYLPLVENTIGNARALGLARALTGPMTRGDVGTLEAHAATLAAHAPDVAALHREVSLRAIAIAEGRGAIDAETARDLRAALGPPPGGPGGAAPARAADAAAADAASHRRPVG